MGYANNWVIIDGLVRIEIKFSERCDVTQFFFLRQFEGHVCSCFVQDLCMNVYFLDYKILVYLI